MVLPFPKKSLRTGISNSISVKLTVWPVLVLEPGFNRCVSVLSTFNPQGFRVYHRQLQARTALARSCGRELDEADLQDRVNAGKANADREEKIGHHRPILEMCVMHVIVDDGLHSDLHVRDAGQNEKQHQTRRKGLAKRGANPGVILAHERKNEPDKCNRERNKRDRSYSKVPGILGARPRGPKKANLARGGLQGGWISRHDDLFLQLELATRTCGD